MNPFTYINHDTWLEDRNKGIGASDISILCGQSTFMTPLELWEQKTKNTQKEVSEDLQKLFDAGHDQEPVTLWKYLKGTYINENIIFDYHLNKRNGTDTSFLLFTEFHHPSYNFMFAHPDMIYFDGKEHINVEAKFIKYKGLEWDFDDLTSNGIPFKYYLQVQFQMMCTGLKKTILIANYQGVDFYEFEIEANEELFLKLEKICFDFWQLVEKKQPPMPSSRADVRKLFPNKNFKSLSLIGEIESDTVMQKYRFNFLKDKIKKMENEKESIKTNVMSLMTENNVLQTADGEQIARIGISKPSEKILKLSEIKKEHTNVYKYLKKKDMISETTKETFYF